VHRAFDPGIGSNISGSSLRFVADRADQRALGTSRDVTSRRANDFRFDRREFRIAGVGLHDDDHRVLSCVGPKTIGRLAWRPIDSIPELLQLRSRAAFAITGK